MRITERLTIIALCSIASASAQPYDTVLRGGRVIDPASGIDARMDVAVTGDRIVSVQADIPAAQARKVLDVSGFYVVPGLIDLHAHVFGYDGSLEPDETALPAGTTTIVDAGGSGWRTFDEFRRTVIAVSKTRVLALINIVGKGMVGEPYESDIADMDPAKTAETILRNKDVIVGIKTAHFSKPGWTAIDRAVEAGRRANTPVMVDDKIFTNSGRTTKEELLDHLRPGDIHTHMYNDRQIEVIDRFNGKVQPWMIEARRRGVFFDVGHGGGSFLWPVAARAVAQGFVPDTISTDLHKGSAGIQQSTMPNVMSKMMLLGMSFPEVLIRSTVNPAKEIGRYPELGTLGVGRVADIAVLEEQSGVFAFKDSWPAKRLGTKRLECVLTVRGGKVVYERGSGATTSGATTSGATSAKDTKVYDVLIKHGHWVDPANHRDEELDIGVIGGKIAEIGRRLPAAHARVIIEAEGYDLRREDGNAAPCGAAAAMKNTPELGRNELSAGKAADIALFQAVDGRQRCVLGMLGGRIVWDSEGLSIPDVSRAGPYSNFK
jgi:dihydroorotase